MTVLDKRLSPNRDEVVSKVIDGEAIIINLSNGIYYSMDKVAGLIWDLIDRETRVEEIVGEITARYDVTRSQVEAHVKRLVEELFQEKLVVESNGEVVSDKLPEGVVGQRLDYEAPALNIYRDMGDLLALDPPQPGLENTPWKEATDGPSGEATE